LNQASQAGDIAPIGLVCVLNHEFDYKKIYHHFTRELKVNYLNFLLPDRNRDANEQQKASVSEYGDALCTLFDEWLEHGMDNVTVRQFSELLKHFIRKVEYKNAPKGYTSNQIVVIHSDGDITFDDTLMPATEWYQTAATANVREITLRGWLSQDIFAELWKARDTLPDECSDCRWSLICRGGDVENRFSKLDGFNGKSVYCSALMKFYDHVAETMILGGYPPDQLTASIRRAPRPLDVDVV